MELKKGNWDNLEGSVLVYAKLKNFETPGKPIQTEERIIDDGTVYAMYFSEDITRFTDKIGMPKQTIDEIINHAKSSIERNIPDFELSSNMVLYIAILGEYKESDLPISDNDNVLFMGNFSTQRECGDYVRKGSDYYFERFAKQMRRGLPLEEDGNTEIVSIKTFEDIEKGQLKGFLSKEYVVPMINSASIDVNQMNRYIRAFIRFAETNRNSKQISKDVHELCRHVQRNRVSINTRLVEAYLNKMEAIHSEEWDSAAKYRDIVNELK